MILGDFLKLWLIPYDIHVYYPTGGCSCNIVEQEHACNAYCCLLCAFRTVTGLESSACSAVGAFGSA